jgi:DNA replication protein DnaC
LFLGKPGVGKSHLGIAYGVLAARRGYSVRFYKATKLLTDLYATLADGSTDRFIGRLARIDLLILDDLHHFSPTRLEYATLLFELVEARHRKATILSSNLPISAWGDVLGNSSLTAAIVDRLMDGAHIINIKRAKSYRSEGPEAPPEEDRPPGLGQEPDDTE